MRNDPDRPSLAEAYAKCVRGRSTRDAWPVPFGPLRLAVVPGLVVWTSDSDAEVPVTSIEPFLRAISGESRSGRQWRLEISAEEHHLQSDGREVFYSVGGELQWKAGGQHCDVLLGVLFACGEPDWHTRVAWVPARF